MKKLIGVAALLLALIISIIYRQLTGHPARSGRIKLSVPTVVYQAQENILLASLMTQ
jgi:hypothetical protein